MSLNPGKTCYGLTTAISMLSCGAKLPSYFGEIRRDAFRDDPT